MHSRSLLLPCALALAPAACQQGAVPAPTTLHLSPPAVRAAPGDQVCFAVTSPPDVTASDVCWSVDPAGCGAVDGTVDGADVLATWRAELPGLLAAQGPAGLVATLDARRKALVDLRKTGRAPWNGPLRGPRQGVSRGA